jgi:protein phosphatase 1 regulatory subunit 37
VAALKNPPETGILSLKLDDCALRPAALEALSKAVRTSSLRNISLRHNRINATGAVALALMIKDYPDSASIPLSSTSPASSAPPSPISSSASLPLSPVLPAVPQSPQLGSTALTSRQHPPTSHTPHQSSTANGKTNSLPPPPHRTAPATPQLQTTYTPYVPRSRRGAAGVAASQAAPPPRTPTAPAAAMSSVSPPASVPIITSSAQGGVTTRTTHQGPSAALLDKVRALDNLPRLGALRTLDLRGNDLRAQGISYLGQVLKRNRTLKVLNLSENKLDVQCLVSIAEALKYNNCLETLDLSRNACSGPGLEGVN